MWYRYLLLIFFRSYRNVIERELFLADTTRIWSINISRYYYFKSPEYKEQVGTKKDVRIIYSEISLIEAKSLISIQNINSILLCMWNYLVVFLTVKFFQFSKWRIHCCRSWIEMQLCEKLWNEWNEKSKRSCCIHRNNKNLNGVKIGLKNIMPYKNFCWSIKVIIKSIWCTVTIIIWKIHLDHAVLAPSVQPLNGTLFEKCRIALAVDDELAVRTIHHQTNMEVGLDSCTRNNILKHTS